MGTLALRAPSYLTSLGLRVGGKGLRQSSLPGQNDATKSSKGRTPDNRPLPGSEKKQTLRRSLFRWKWEILGMVLSLLSLAASIILLGVHNDRRVDSWTAPFTLNTFLSILAQTSRTSLAFGVGSSLGQAKWNIFSKQSGNLALFEAFDEASKGPWGSLSLLYRLRSWRLAIIGAAVVTILLSYEPFIQASVTQYGELDEGSSSSGPGTSISRAERLDLGSLSRDPNIAPGGPNVVGTDADLGLLTSVFRGFSTPKDMVTLPQFTCPTGNCTFGNFASLGVCSSCADVSSHVVAKHYTDYPSKPGRTTNFTKYWIPWMGESDGIGSYDGFRDRTSDEDYEIDLPGSLGATVFLEDTISFNKSENGTAFLVFGIIEPQSDYIHNISTWQNTTPKGTECGLYFCTNVFSSSVVEGILNETLVASLSNRNADSYEAQYEAQYEAYGNFSAANSDWKPYSLFQLEDLPRSDLQLFIPDDEAKLLQLPDDQPRRFNISQAMIFTTIASMGEIFIELSWIDTPGINTPNLGIYQVIQISRDLNATFRAVVDSITVFMRDTAHNSSANHGASHVWVPYYRIRWEFLIPPLSLTLAGCLFLSYTIWETQSLGLMAWKQSTLATLAHGLDTLTRVKMREAYQDSTEDKSARDILVRAEKFRGGIELCEV
ncbi:hypothetical protein F4801DRAFT_598372 [Xylaria longipes]|nr:hypothetical protein F4801DRAFT_598372 [Xylaria longipes]